MNHNLETVPRLYAQPGGVGLPRIRSGSPRYFKAAHDTQQRPTKSGLMVGLGETNEEILDVMRDLRANDGTCSPSGSTCSLQEPPSVSR